jgi:hypothetical protein
MRVYLCPGERRSTCYEGAFDGVLLLLPPPPLRIRLAKYSSNLSVGKPSFAPVPGVSSRPSRLGGRGVLDRGVVTVGEASPPPLEDDVCCGRLSRSIAASAEIVL